MIGVLPDRVLVDRAQNRRHFVHISLMRLRTWVIKRLKRARFGALDTCTLCGSFHATISTGAFGQAALY